MLSRLVKMLASELKMENDITAHENGHYTLAFADEIDVEAFELSKSLLLKGNIAAAPEKNREAIFIQIMEANLFGSGTRSATIGWLESDNMLTLCRELDYNCSEKEFKEKLEDFVSVIDFWRKRVLKLA